MELAYDRGVSDPYSEAVSIVSGRRVLSLAAWYVVTLLVLLVAHDGVDLFYLIGLPLFAVGHVLAVRGWYKRAYSREYSGHVDGRPAWVLNLGLMVMSWTGALFDTDSFPSTNPFAGLAVFGLALVSTAFFVRCVLYTFPRPGTFTPPPALSKDNAPTKASANAPAKATAPAKDDDWSKDPDMVGYFDPVPAPAPAKAKDPRKEVAAAWEKVKSGMDVKEAGFASDEVRIVLGALGEVRTSSKLATGLTMASSLRWATIINGLAIASRSGTSADIDHLVLTDKGHVTVDSKVWGKAPDLVRDSRGGGYMLTKNGPFWETISTCIYEAEQLPAPPAAILVAVSGSASRSPSFTAALAANDGMIPITSYIDRFTEDMSRPSIPVYLVAQRDVDVRVLDALRRHPYQGRVIDVAALDATPGLVVPRG